MAEQPPGWQSSAWQSGVRALNRIALAWPFFRMDKLTTLTPTRSDSSVRIMPRSARSLSKWMVMAWASGTVGDTNRYGQSAGPPL
jgi:hypothetical protein